jgi:hypothetical protein
MELCHRRHSCRSNGCPADAQSARPATHRAQDDARSMQRMRAWQRHLPRMHGIQDQLSQAKTTLNLLLGASHSYVLPLWLVDAPAYWYMY